MILLAQAAADEIIRGSMTDDPAWLSGLRAVAEAIIAGWTWFALTYTILLQVAFFVMVLVSQRDLAKDRPATRSARRAELLTSAAPVGVSVVMPAFNEAAGIVEGVHAMQQITYPLFEVIVVNDGSTDDTLDRLVEAFDLYPVQAGPAPFPELTTNPVRAVWLSADPSLALRVIDKEAGRTKAYSVNVGVSAAIHPYVVVCDGDSLVSPDAVSMVMAEITTREGVLGAGGTVLPVNDSTVTRGHVTDARVPRRFLAACQLGEYLRSFVIGRAAFGAADSMALISGAFGVFRRADLLRVGGYKPGHLGEDLDLTVRLQRRAAVESHHVGLIQVPEAILWTEVPESLAVLRRQRLRWHRGLMQVIREHARTVANPAYGRFGVLGMGYLFAFEYLAPLIEGVGYLTLVAAVAVGVLDVTTAGLLLGLALLIGFANTALAVFIAESRFRLYRHRGDIFRLLVAAVAEQIGYRQLTVWWRVRAIFSRPATHEWGEMIRRGYRVAGTAALSASVSDPTADGTVLTGGGLP
jgi:cellulose synthase/poly-beta-1,6-N-acetylglucosamine synthase-like glycosyltransferase